MCIYLREDIHRLQHCLYQTFLKEPRLYYGIAGKKCNACRNTASKYWRKGLKEEVFFPPQIRLKMYENRKEYIYLIQNDKAHKLFEYYKKQSYTIFVTYTFGKFDLFLQTNKELDIIPDRTIFSGTRGNYMYPETPFCTYEDALDTMESMIEDQHTPSIIPVEYPKEPPKKGSSHYGWMIYPYVKYNLRTGFTPLVKKLHISFDSFYLGLKYLLNISTMLLPYYPMGYRLYSQYFFVFWSDYEEFLCELFGCLPCHTSITKVGDALIMMISVEKGLLEKRLLQLCYTLIDREYVYRLWNSIPVYYWNQEI